MQYGIPALTRSMEKWQPVKYGETERAQEKYCSINCLITLTQQM